MWLRGRVPHTTCIQGSRPGARGWIVVTVLQCSSFPCTPGHVPCPCPLCVPALAFLVFLVVAVEVRPAVPVLPLSSDLVSPPCLSALALSSKAVGSRGSHTWCTSLHTLP